MSMYTDQIVKATGCAPEDAPEIEEIMREDIFHSTLDWQTRAQLDRAAREAAALLPEIRAIKSRIAREEIP